MLYGVVVFILFIFIFVLFLLNIKCVIEYQRNDTDDNIILSVFILKGNYKYKYEIPIINFQPSGVKFKLVKGRAKKFDEKLESKGRLKITDVFDKYRDATDYYQKNKDIICEIRDYIKNKVNLMEFKLNVIEGAENADHTGIICGVLWSVSGLLSIFLSNTFNVHKKRISIKANFKKKELTVDLFCIFHAKLVYIIAIVNMIYLSRNPKHNRKTGGRTNDGASNRGLDDDSYAKHQGNG